MNKAYLQQRLKTFEICFFFFLAILLCDTLTIKTLITLYLIYIVADITFNHLVLVV